MTSTKKDQIKFKVKIEKEITLGRVRDLLCSAFEGGANYWCRSIVKENYAEGLKSEDFREGGKLTDPDDYHTPYMLVATTEGCSITLSVDNPDDPEKQKKVKFDLKAIEKGLTVMASKYPRHFNDFLEENDDANTGDIFLQCCLFGEEIFA